MFEVGRVCLKIAGRDAGKKCVIVDVLGEGMVLVDGETRRRKVNVKHLEPLEKVVKIKKGASHDEVKAALEQEGIKVRETKAKEKKEKPKKVKKEKKVEEKVEEKKPVKKEEKTGELEKAVEEKKEEIKEEGKKE